MTGDISSNGRMQVCAPAHIYAGLCHSPRAPVILSAPWRLMLLYQTGTFKRNSCLGLHTREFVFLLSKGYMFNFKDKVHCEDDQVPTFLLAARNFEAKHKDAFSSF